MSHEHLQCRPPRGMTNIRRWNPKTKRFAADNGEAGGAFIGEDPAAGDDTSCIVWVVDCRCCPQDERCLRRKAMAEAGARYDIVSVHTRPRMSLKQTVQRAREIKRAQKRKPSVH